MDEKTTAYAIGAAGIITGIGTLIKIIYDAIANSKKQDSDISTTRIAALEAKVDTLHHDHADCLQRAVEAATELRLLKGRILEIEEDRGRLRAEVDRLRGVIEEMKRAG